MHVVQFQSEQTSTTADELAVIIFGKATNINKATDRHFDRRCDSIDYDKLLLLMAQTYYERMRPGEVANTTAFALTICVYCDTNKRNNKQHVTFNTNVKTLLTTPTTNSKYINTMRFFFKQ